MHSCMDLMRSTAFHKASLLLVIVLVFTACKRKSTESETVDVDHISYKVMYLEKMAGDIPTNVLPGVMDAYYSDRYVMTKIDGFFGQFSLVQVADMKKHTVTSMLNFFGNKIYYIGEKGEIPVSIYPLEDPEIEFTEDTLTISGLTSHRVIIHLPDHAYDIYYTKDFNIESPNITTPYSFIDHVLSDFRVQLSYLKMRLIIDEHTEESLDPLVFEIPQEYESVSRDTMEEIGRAHV